MRHSCVGVCVWVAVGYAGSAASLAAPPMTEQQLCDLYLRVVEESVEYFEPLWTDDSQRVPKSGFFDFRKYGNWKDEEYVSAITIPGNGMIAYCYSLLLSESDRPTFSARQVPRAVLLDHAIKSMRWVCLNSGYVDHPYPYPIARGWKGFSHLLKDGHWARAIGSRIDALGWMTLAAARLWPRFDDETRRLIEQVMVGAAPKKPNDRYWEYRQGGNHDNIKQDMASTIGAAFLFPNRPDAKIYRDIVRANGIGMVATPNDRARGELVDGGPVRDWWRGWNLYPDYSSDHHGWAQVWYGCDLIFEGWSYIRILSETFKTPVFGTFAYSDNGFDGVLEWAKTMCLPEGEPASVHGMEYDSYYGSGLLAYCYGAVVRKDPVAAALEERAARLLARHAATGRMYDYHRNSEAKAATAYLIHKIAGPRAKPLSISEAFARLEGTRHLPWQQTLMHRSRNKWVSFSWGSISERAKRRPVGFVVPARLDADAPEPLVYFHEDSLRGTLQVMDTAGKPITGRVPDSIYRHDADDTQMSTAGIVSDEWLTQYYAFHSFDDGPCVLITQTRANKPCAVTWSGLPVYFYVRPGLTPERTCFDAAGPAPLGRSARRRSPWWSVDDALAVATVGGNGELSIARSVGYNWARTEAYRDRCDGVFVAPMSNLRLDAGQTALDLAAAVFFNTPHEEVAGACKIMDEAVPLALPEGWKGLVVPDPCVQGRRYLAVDRFHGHARQAALDLSFEQGAPVLSRLATINGRQSTVVFDLDAPGSLNERIELYVEVYGGATLRACRKTRDRYVLEPTGGKGAGAKVRLRFATNEHTAPASGRVHPGRDLNPERERAAQTERAAQASAQTERAAQASAQTERAAQASAQTERAAQASANDDSTTLLISSPGTQQLLPARSLRNDGEDIDLGGRAVIEVQRVGHPDETGPAVEIAALTVREDGEVHVEVTAADCSGVESVALYCDGKPAGRKTGPPYVWALRPADGPHTFHAVAADASPARNHRASCKRTVDVAAAKGAF
jgi:hypothetical protein